ncbi:MAG: sugar ABC transporter substrate-binding protein [Betaproteobacteria bacterium AqS2]|uniref:Sugar ABC transporter substrate-binding protein n=1 Tax=Candidatus Amphirhobacter heronislandensis TaxID=1732024 RepID=A0A930UHS3_9GAMM|nr:sugar ABC transporter substrate-binding protein [Betaproteobacteria bacterium AqS2]
MNKAKLAAIVGLAAVLAAPAAFAEKYIVITHTAGTDPFWPVVQRAAEDAARDMGVEMEYRHPANGDLVEMARIVEAATAQNPAGIVVSLPDASVLGQSVRDAVAAGIPVVSINSGGDVARELGVLAHVGQPEYEAGLGAGQKHAAMGAKNILCLNHEAFNVALEQRCNGYRDGAKADSFEMIDVTSDPAEIKTRTSAALQKDSSIDAILAVGPHVCEAAIGALQDLGKEGVIDMGCFDLSPKVVNGIKEGWFNFAVDQQQYLQGYMPIVILKLHNAYGLTPGGDILSGPGFVTNDNVAIVEQFAGQTR